MDKKDELMGAILAAAMLSGIGKKAETNSNKEEKDMRTIAKELGELMYQSYLGFQDAGFTPTQAFRLLQAMAQK